MKPRTRRQIGFAIGAACAAAMLLVLTSASGAHFHAKGPMNSGHADLACSACHREAPGTTRQQLQSVAGRWLGTRDSSVDVGFQDVDNAPCLSCHERADDRHPVARFLEPRFAAQRAALAPQRCESCHAEHSGKRVTVSDAGFCRNCHQELALTHDSIDVPHAQLVAEERWGTCLTCHDFHGNHEYAAPTRLQDGIPSDRIRAYLSGGRSPYPGPVRQPAHAQRPPLKDE